MSGVLVNGRCLAPEAGQGAYWSSVGASLTETGHSAVEYVSGAWVQRTYTGGVLQSSYPLPTPSLYPCDPLESVLDGFVLAGAVISVWAIAWAFNILRRVL